MKNMGGLRTCAIGQRMNILTAWGGEDCNHCSSLGTPDQSHVLLFNGSPGVPAVKFVAGGMKSIVYDVRSDTGADAAGNFNQLHTNTRLDSIKQ